MSERPKAPAVSSLSTQERATLGWVLRVVVGCVTAVAALLFGLGLVLPNRWNVTREILIHAPTTAIHPLVEDWHAWEGWARDPGDDPTLVYSYSGALRGAGAVREFSGKYAGTGRSELVACDPASGATFVSAVRNQKNNASGTLTYHAQGGSTSVVWNDQGTIESLFGVFLRANVEDELTKYIDRSLQRLKALAEEQAKQKATGSK